MKSIDRIKQAVGSVGIRLKTYFNQGNWVDSNLPGRIYSSSGGRFYAIPGTRVNWDRLTGDLWTCPAVQACLNIMHRNLVQAPWMVYQKKQTKGRTESVPVPDHPILARLNRPNPIYDGQVLRDCIVDSLKMTGNAYIVMERTNGQAVAELWWVPNDWVQPYTQPDNRMPMAVDYWRVNFANRQMIVPPEDMIHLRLGSDPTDPRLGLSELASASRDVNTLQQLANYKPNILRNMGVVGKFIRPKDGTVLIDPVEVKEKIDAASTVDNVGSTVVVDFPAEVDYPGVSPKDLDTGAMGDMPEANICALMGVPAQVVGLHVGRLSKTYANIKEAREQLWEECLIPLGNLIACQMGYRLLPEYAANRDPEYLEAYMAEYALALDYTDVRPLQPDLDALNTRELEVFKAGITTVAQFCANTFRDEPDPAIADLYYSDLQAPPEPMDGTDGTGKPNATQTVTTAGKSAWEARVEAELMEIERQSVFALNGNGVH